MDPRCSARNPQSYSVSANPEAARLLTSLFEKGIVKKGAKARKWHQHPNYCTKFLQVALEKFRKRYTQSGTEKFGENNF